jgi:hypothetical protein
MKVSWVMVLKIALFGVLILAGLGSLIHFDTLLLVAAFLAGMGLILCYCPRVFRQAFVIAVLFLLWALIALGPLRDPWMRLNLAFQAKAISEDAQALLSIVTGGRLPGPEPGFSQSFLESAERRLESSDAFSEDTLALGWVGLLGESPRALNWSRDLVKRYPRLAVGRWVLVHHLYNSEGQSLEEAFAQMDTLTAMDSLNAAPMVNRAALTREDKQRDQAVRDLMAAGGRPFYLPYGAAIIRAKWKALERAGLLDVRTKAIALYERSPEAPWTGLMAVTDSAIQTAEVLARSGKREEAEQALRTLAELGDKIYKNPLEYGDLLGWRMKRKVMSALIANDFQSAAEEERREAENPDWNTAYALQVSGAQQREILVLRIAILLWALSSIAVMILGFLSLFQRKLFRRALLWSGLISILAMGCLAIQSRPLKERQQLFLNAPNPDMTTYALVPREVFGLMNDYCTGGV